MKSNKVLLAIIISITIGLLVAIGVLGVYWYYLGPISHLAADWGSFGSVMSGAFTLLSSFATIGTLLFLYLQQAQNEKRQIEQDRENIEKQQKHDEIVKKQLAALTFEQYLNHRKLFIERLHEQASFFRDIIYFPNPEKIYTQIFKKNSPSNCEYKVFINKTGEETPYDLTDLIETYNSVSQHLEKNSNIQNNFDLITETMRLQDGLGFSYKIPPRNGGIFFCGVFTGINIYEIDKTFVIIEQILNSILFYTGNNELPKINHKAQGRIIRDNIYNNLRKHNAKRTFEIKHDNKSITYLHEIYDKSQIRINSIEPILNESFKRISIFLSNIEELTKLDDFAVLLDLTNSIYIEIQNAKNKYSDDAEAIKLLDDIERTWHSF